MWVCGACTSTRDVAVLQVNLEKYYSAVFLISYHVRGACALVGSHDRVLRTVALAVVTVFGAVMFNAVDIQAIAMALRCLVSLERSKVSVLCAMLSVPGAVRYGPTSQ